MSWELYVGGYVLGMTSKKIEYAWGSNWYLVCLLHLLNLMTCSQCLDCNLVDKHFPCHNLHTHTHTHICSLKLWSVYELLERDTLRVPHLLSHEERQRSERSILWPKHSNIPITSLISENLSASRHITAQFRWQVERGQHVIDRNYPHYLKIPSYLFPLVVYCSNIIRH